MVSLILRVAFLSRAASLTPVGCLQIGQTSMAIVIKKTKPAVAPKVEAASLALKARCTGGWPSGTPPPPG